MGRTQWNFDLKKKRDKSYEMKLVMIFLNLRRRSHMLESCLVRFLLCHVFLRSITRFACFQLPTKVINRPNSADFEIIWDRQVNLEVRFFDSVIIRFCFLGFNSKPLSAAFSWTSLLCQSLSLLPWNCFTGIHSPLYFFSKIPIHSKTLSHLEFSPDIKFCQLVF